MEDFEREVIGRIPKNVPRVTWSVTATDTGTIGGRRVVGTQLIGHVDNSAYPAITVDIPLTVVLPADAKGPVPVMIMFRSRLAARRARQTAASAPAGARPGVHAAAARPGKRRTCHASSSSSTDGDSSSSVPPACRPTTARG